MCLINNRIKFYSLVFISISVLSIAYPNLDFKTKIAQICWKLSKVYYFEVDHSEFYKPNFGDLWVASFPISGQRKNDQLS